MINSKDALDLVAARAAAFQTFLPLAMAAGRAGFWNYDVVEDRMRYCFITAALYGLPIERRFEGVPIARIAERVHPGDLEAYSRRLATLRENGGRVQASYRTVPADDTIKLVTVRGLCTADADGRVVQACGIILDMTAEPVSNREEPVPLALERLGSDVALDQAVSLGLACHRAVYAMDSSGALRWAVDALLLELGRQIATELDHR